MKRKRLLSLFLILAVGLSLTGCHIVSDVDTDVTASSSVITTTTTQTEEAPTSTTTVVEATTTTATAKPTPTVIPPTTTASTVAATTTAPTVLAADKQTVDAAFRLGVGESLPDTVRLTGVVTRVKEISENYGNATFDLQVEGSDGVKTIHCYRVKPADGFPLAVAVGDTLTLTGTIQNYNGTIEFCQPSTYYSPGYVDGGVTTTRPTGGSAAIAEDGIYESKVDVALYLHTYGRLPKNFVTKSEYNALGKPANKCCGGDRFYNKEGLLPNKAGRLYYECDIDTYGTTSRGSKRIVYSNDGLIYYTGDHYESFTLLYGEP